MRREKELSKENMSFLSLERMQWRIGKVGVVEFEATTRCSLGRKHRLMLVCRNLSWRAQRSSYINIEMIIGIMMMGEGRRMEKTACRGRWLSIGHTFGNFEKRRGKRDIKGATKDRRTHRNSRIRY